LLVRVCETVCYSPRRGTLATNTFSACRTHFCATCYLRLIPRLHDTTGCQTGL